MVLPDVLGRDLCIVFCGTAAGAASALLGQYYAGPGNRFWPTLARVGLTPRELKPSEYRDVLSYGLGLTDVVKGQSGSDSSLDFRKADTAQLRARIEKYRPRILCFTSKRAAKAFFGAKHVELGLQNARIGETLIFVAPSPSGLAKKSWDEEVWRDLARLARRSCPDRAAGESVAV